MVIPSSLSASLAYEGSHRNAVVSENGETCILLLAVVNLSQGDLPPTPCTTRPFSGGRTCDLLLANKIQYTGEGTDGRGRCHSLH